jgi:glycosyltransferase involved in cell wall biosynthesis
MARSVAFVGPLPPPVNGFSSVCAMMLELLRTKMPVQVFDRAPKVNSRFSTMLQQLLLRPLGYFGACIAHRNVILYLALSGGRGQIFDLGYVLVSKLFRRRVFIHHHSFAYINAPSFLNRCVFSLLRKDAHIVLSRKMGDSLAGQYGLDASGITVVSNAAFYDSTHDDTRTKHDEHSPLHIGFLSNITFEKGFVEFFAILEQLKMRGIAYRAHIAGPLAPAAREIFDKLFNEASDVDYAGPVYGAEKERFYQQLDIFVFPTRYVNEAEPLVVYEAMRHGVYVIACDRGAISEMLCNGAGVAFAAETVVDSAVLHIGKFSADRAALTSSRRMSLQQAQRIRSSGRVQLEKLLQSMQGGLNLVSIST